jgi:MMP 1-O-methyltransferase
MNKGLVLPFYKSEIKHIKEATAQIGGWLTDAEGEFLYNAARNCQGKGTIVEIGSWKGKSTIWLAKGSKRGCRSSIYCIDPHTGSAEHRKKGEELNTLEEFRHNLKEAEVDDIVVPIVKTSRDAALNWNGKPVELLWIDGSHQYEMVKLDFDLWFPLLVDGGLIAFHDTLGWPGPIKVVKDHIYNSCNFAGAGFIDSLTHARKVRANSPQERLGNRWRLFLLLFQNELLKAARTLPVAKPLRKMTRQIISSFQ